MRASSTDMLQLWPRNKVLVSAVWLCYTEGCTDTGNNIRYTEHDYNQHSRAGDANNWDKVKHSMRKNVGMWWSQPKSASVGSGFYMQNPSDVDLSRDQN